MQSSVMKKISLLVFVVVVSLGATSCSAKKPSPASIATSGTPGAAATQIKEQYVQSLERARVWQENATLSRVYRLYNGAINPDPLPPLVFSYTSLAEPSKAYEVLFSGTSVTERKVPLSTYELSLTPIDVTAWEVDAVKAIQLAEDAGGRTFRENHLAGFKVLQQLQLRGTYPLMWFFQYDTADGSNLRYEMYVNAKTGAIEFQREIALTAT